MAEFLAEVPMPCGGAGAVGGAGDSPIVDRRSSLRAQARRCACSAAGAWPQAASASSRRGWPRLHGSRRGQRALPGQITKRWTGAAAAGRPGRLGARRNWLMPAERPLPAIKMPDGRNRPGGIVRIRIDQHLAGGAATPAALSRPGRAAR